jgi:hypothetical protein
MVSRSLQAVSGSLGVAFSWLSQAYHSSMVFPSNASFPCRCRLHIAARLSASVIAAPQAPHRASHSAERTR